MMKVVTNPVKLNSRCKDVDWVRLEGKVHMPKEWNKLIIYLKVHKKTAVGISANQLGIDMRMCCFWNNNKIDTLINPYLSMWSGETKDEEEMCLSLPKKKFLIKRHDWVEVIDDTHTNPQRFDGWMARVVQHEVDHLNGITIKERRERWQEQK